MTMTPQWGSPPPYPHRRFSPMADQRINVGIGVFAGVANIGLNFSGLATHGPLPAVDHAFMVAALVIIALLPLRPVWGVLAYLLCWFLLLAFPNTYASDMLLTHLRFSFSQDDSFQRDTQELSLSSHSQPTRYLYNDTPPAS